PVISISADAVTFDGRMLLQTSDMEKGDVLNVPELEDALREEKRRYEQIHANDPDHPFRGLVNVQADRRIPFKVIKRVMFACNQSGFGNIICALGFAFGLVIYAELKKLPVHRSMLEVSELIYETCKTYLITQGKFILLLEAFIGTIMVIYFGALRHFEAAKVITILVFSLLGIGGSYGVAWFGIRVNTFANS